MATAGNGSQSEGNGLNVQHVEDPNQNLTPEMEAKIEALRISQKPVNILVIGRSDVGKSALINAMFGENVAEVGHGAESVTTEIKFYEKKHMDITMRLCDTVGFRDTKGKSNRDILFNIGDSGKFDLILICSRLGGRVEQGMFTGLALHLHEEMWKRTVVVLTQANQFITLDSVLDMGPEEAIKAAIKEKVDEYKDSVVKHLAGRLKKEVLEGIPFCIAGSKYQKKILPTMDDEWLQTLWHTCVDHSSGHTCDFLSVFARWRLWIEAGIVVASTGAGAGTGAAIGAGIGSSVPVLGTAVGAAAGGIIGGGAAILGVNTQKKKLDF